MIATSLPAVEISLDSKLAFLRQPRSYPDPTVRVEAVETHLSWVFLTDHHAYKLKKPVCYGAPDFRTMQARHFYCEEEIRLNRRLAPDVYLGIVALAIDSTGHLQLQDDGTVTDWLVKMRRLPAQQMLDYAIKTGSATAADLARVAERLADFYRACSPAIANPGKYRNRLRKGIDAGLAALRAPAYRLPVDMIERICAGQHDFLQRLSGVFDERVRAGRIIEGHGDLRPEHICLAPELAIIDCLEFSRDLRIVDTADELAFLALECERLGAADLGDVLLRRYGEISGDAADDALLHFYRSYRASVRARIAIRHLDEEKFRYSAEWPRRAMEYLRLAERHVQCR